MSLYEREIWTETNMDRGRQYEDTARMPSCRMEECLRQPEAGKEAWNRFSLRGHRKHHTADTLISDS